MTYGAYHATHSAAATRPSGRMEHADDGAGAATDGGTPPGVRQEVRRILVLDDQALTRDCTEKWLSTAYADATITTASGLDELTNDVIAGLRGKLAFCLYNIHRARASDTKVDGDLASLRRLFAGTPVIVISDLDHQERVIQALQRGVRGFIPTSASLDVAVEATRLVSAGGTFVPVSSLLMQPRGQNALDDHGAGSAFTQRQLAVLKCLREGKANKIIAHELSMSVSTVKVHVRNIMQKLKATNRTQVAYQTRQLFAAED